MTETEMRERIREVTGAVHHGPLRIARDTTEFMRIGAGDVLELSGRLFYLRGEEQEGRFGLDGEPKFWVKRALDLADGSPRVVKLVFHERFEMRLGEVAVACFRSPEKESRILEKVRGDHRFMQGETLPDAVGNPVRVIERIRGVRFYDMIEGAPEDHGRWFHERFPAVFRGVLGAVWAIADLHRLGEVHGDIRNDHILIERETALWRWIDFDYTYEWRENPWGVDLFGLGNVLLFAAGKGFHTLPSLAACGPEGMRLRKCLTPEDMSLFFPHRVMNLRKLFPWVPESLNRVLLRFSAGAETFYESVGELMEDLAEARREVGA